MNPLTAHKILREMPGTYNAIAREFDATRQAVWDGFEAFLPYVKDGDRVLDAGCGNGRLLKLLVDKKIQYVGCDVSANLLAAAKKNYPSQAFVEGSLLTLPFANGEFDVVFCIAVFHHLPGVENRRQALAELRRVLKHGGILIMTNWDRLTPGFFPHLAKATLKKVLGLSDLDFRDAYIPWKNSIQRYYHCFTLSELERLVAKNGFSLIASYKTRGKRRNLVIIAQKS